MLILRFDLCINFSQFNVHKRGSGERIECAIKVKFFDHGVICSNVIYQIYSVSECILIFDDFSVYEKSFEM